MAIGAYESIISKTFLRNRSGPDVCPIVRCATVEIHVMNGTVNEYDERIGRIAVRIVVIDVETEVRVRPAVCGIEVRVGKLGRIVAQR